MNRFTGSTAMVNTIRVGLTRTLVAVTATAAIATVTSAQSIPISGRPVPLLSAIDTLMVDYMTEHDIEAGVIGLMRNGDIIYLRGFGNLTDGVPMPENALVRLASVTKAVTSAATRQLIADGNFGLNTPAFAIGANGGVLSVNPFGGAANQVNQITINHLLRHQGGWDRGAPAGDLTYNEIAIAADMGVASPPGRPNTIDWILGQPLDFAPGSDTIYSNVGCLALGLIVEQVTGQGLIQYVRQNILTPAMGVPASEIRQGTTFREWNHVREPWYRSDSTGANVFFPAIGPQTVSRPYGSWDHEARVGQGGMIASAAAMLHLAEHYHVVVGGTIGTPRATQEITGNQGHDGVLHGTNTYLEQRTNGVNFFVFVNERRGSGTAYATELRNQIRTVIQNTTTWPTATSDGFWVKPLTPLGGGQYAQGGYDAPINGFTNAVNLDNGSKVRLVPGTGTNFWTGTISKRMTIDAPLGPVTIGQ